MAAGGGGGGEAGVQKALQSVAQRTGWTYSLLWRLCPRQGALVWAEGHYNGAIKTRKTTVLRHQPGAVVDARDEEERRSRQLKELYDSLAAAVVPPRPPAAALAPEDLTETEWFYLMCASYSFPPAVG